MKNCEKGLKNASKVASPCLLQACFLFAIDVFLHFDRRSELTPFIIMVSLIWRKVFLDSLTFSNSYGSRHYRDYTSTQSPKVEKSPKFYFFARMHGSLALSQPRSQGLSSLPPLVVGRKTLVAAGHEITCDTNLSIELESTNNWSERKFISYYTSEIFQSFTKVRENIFINI